MSHVIPNLGLQSCSPTQSPSKYPPAEPEVLRLLAPQRGLTVTGEKQPQQPESSCTIGRSEPKATAGSILPEFSKFDCLPGRAGGTPGSISGHFQPDRSVAAGLHSDLEFHRYVYRMASMNRLSFRLKRKLFP